MAIDRDTQYKIAQYLTGYGAGLAPALPGIDRPKGGPFPEFCSEGFEDARSGEALGLAVRAPRYVTGPDAEILRVLREAAGDGRNPQREGGAFHPSQIVTHIAQRTAAKLDKA